jgi:hypothetical protein
VRLTPLAAGLVAGCALFMASCASSNDPRPAPTTTEATQPAGHGAYAACLAEHGVPKPPAGPVAPPGVDAETWAKAQQACTDKAPGPAA